MLKKSLAVLAVVLSWFFTLGVLAQVIAPGFVAGSNVVGQQDVLRAYYGDNEPFLLDDANTVMHCKGSDFDGATPRCGKTMVSHRSVGPFSATSYFNGGTWASNVNDTIHMGCTIFQPTTAGAGLLVQNSDLANVGYRLKVNAGQTVSLDVFTSAGVTTVTTANTAAINQQHVVCHGYDGAGGSAYVQLDGGAVASAAVAGVPGTYTGATLIGYDGLGFTPAFTGTIAEIWVRGKYAPWNAVTAAAIAAGVLATTSPSPALPGLDGANGVAGDRFTVAHCVGDDYVGGGWNCNPGRTKRTSVGSFSTGANAPAGYLYLGVGGDVLDLPAAGFRTCAVFDVPPTAFGATTAVVEAMGANDGWDMWYDNAAPPNLTCTYASGGAITNVTVPGVIVGATNIGCCGRDVAGTNYVTINAGVLGAVAGAYTPDAINSSFIGRALGGGSPNFGRVREVWASTTSWNSGAMATFIASALAKTGSGAIMTGAASDANTVLWTVFDDWTGTGVRSRVNTGAPPDWLTVGSIGRARDNNNWPATRIALTGWVASIDAPFNWPSVAWAMVGTVPASRSSAGFPTGFGPERRQLGGFTDAAYVGMATANDVLDLAQFTGCIGWYQGNLAVAEVIYSNGLWSFGGIYLYHAAASANLLVYFNGGGAAVASTVVITANADNVVCFGRDAGGNGYAVANASAVVGPTAAPLYVTGTAYQAFLGRYGAAGTPATNSRLKEFWFSSTPVTSAYLTQQAQATLRCNTPGACIPEDSNTVIHCTIDTDWSGGLRCSKNLGNQAWATVGAPTLSSAPYQWAYGTTGVDREGMGNFTDANYFTLGTGVDPLDFTAAGWEVCAVFKHDAVLANNPIFIDNSVANTSGFYMRVTNAGALACQIHSGGGNVGATTANTTVVNGLNIGCCGYDGTTVRGKLNGGVTASAVRAYSVPNAAVAYMGRYSGAGFSFAGKIYEVWATNTPFTEAATAARQARFMNLYAGSYGEVETFTRATTSSTEDPNKNLSYVPAGMPVQEKNGLLGFSQRRNDETYSEDLTQNPPYVPTNLGVTPNTVAAPDGQTTAETLTDNANNTAHELVMAYVATAAAWTVSAHARAGTLGWIHLSADNANFTWFNLATCAVGTNAAGNTAVVYTSIPGWCRVAVTRTMGAGAASASIGVSGVDAVRAYIGAGGTLYAWGAQIELGSYAGPYIPTTNLAVQRNLDLNTMVNPLTGNTDWCVEADYTPYAFKTTTANWTPAWNGLFQLGTFATPNSATLYAITTSVYLAVYDSGGVLKTASRATGFAVGSTHKIKGCSLGGVLEIWFDGVKQAVTITGVGTGIISAQPATITVPATYSGNYFDGYVKNLVVDPPLLPSSEVTLRQPFNFSDPVDITLAGVPAPGATGLDCRGSQYVGGATWPCTGGTGTKFGAPTSGNRTPYGPSGFATTTAPETSAYFNSGTPDYFNFGDALDQTGDFSVCAIYQTNAIGAGNRTIIGKRGASTSFWWFLSSSTNQLQVRKADGSNRALSMGNVVANEWNVGCAAYDWVTDGTSILRGNINGVAPAELTDVLGPPPDIAPSLIISSSGAEAWSGYIARVLLWTGRAFTAAQLAQIVSLLQTGVAPPVTNSRTGVATYMPHGPSATIPSLFNASARTPRVEQNGVLAEGARTNRAWPSEDLSHARWVKSAGMAVLVDQGTFVDGNVTMDRLTSTLNTDTALQTVVSASTTTFPASGWARSVAGSTVQSIIGACPAANNVTACACATNTGLACTAAINPGALNECYAYATFTTAPVRIWVNYTCTAATTAPAIGFHDGQYLVTAAVGGIFGGAQLEEGLYPTSYIPTSTGVGPRVADANQQTNTLRDSQTRWCVKATATPENGRAWGANGAGVNNVLVSSGTANAANTFNLFENGANIVGRVYDNAGALRSVTWAHGYAAGSVHTLYLCSNAGVLSLWSDGVNTGTAPAGAGTGVITAQQQPLYVGGASAGWTFDGNLAYVDQCPNADPTRCW